MAINPKKLRSSQNSFIKINIKKYAPQLNFTLNNENMKLYNFIIFNPIHPGIIVIFFRSFLLNFSIMLKKKMAN